MQEEKGMWLEVAEKVEVCTIVTPRTVKTFILTTKFKRDITRKRELKTMG